MEQSRSLTTRKKELIYRVNTKQFRAEPRLMFVYSTTDIKGYERDVWSHREELETQKSQSHELHASPEVLQTE